MSIMEKLAEDYPHLYIRPRNGGTELYRAVALRGKEPEEKSLSHFTGSDDDELWIEKTLAGDVRILYLPNRSDFETFLQIASYRCEPVEIPKTTGAMTILGMVNRGKITRHMLDYAVNGGTDFQGEFARFASKKENYIDTMVVLSCGPYSGVDAETAGVDAARWEEISRNIRLYHECTHVVCRRKFPGNVNAVCDEIIADAVGIMGALGHYDEDLACKFLGIADGKYVGGRLENYLKENDGEEGAPHNADSRRQQLDEVAEGAFRMIREIAELANQMNDNEPYEFLMTLCDQYMRKRG